MNTTKSDTQSRNPAESTIQNSPTTLQPDDKPNPLAQMDIHEPLVQHPITALQTRPAENQHPASPTSVEVALAVPNPVTRGPHSRPRNGKIARLPKLHRDMVNRMLYNHLPHAEIVAALGECDIKVTERNISNWKTRGGYKEWCLEQERQIYLARLQDNLVDYLRKNDAAQLPEVGLQVAATHLSHLFLQPDTAQQLAANPQKYRQVVDMLCRLTTHIQSLQKDRNEAVERAAIRGTSEHFKQEQEKDIEALRQVFSSTRGERPQDDIPHRNELPKRDKLPQPRPQIDFLEFLKIMTKKKPTPLSAPESKPLEESTQNTVTA